MRRPYIILLLCIVVKVGFSQATIFDKIGKKDGLPDNNVFSMVEDEYGHLWFGTSNGLALYNGYSFRTWRHEQQDSTSLPDNMVQILLATTHHELLVGYIDLGMFRFDYQRELFVPLDSKQKNPTKKWLAGHYSKKRVIWVGSSEGLEYYDSSSSTLKKVDLKIDGNFYVSSIEEDPYGCLWLFCSSNTIAKYNPQTGKTETFSYSDSKKSLSYRGGRVLYDPSGYIWVGTEQDGLYRIRLRDSVITHFSTANKMLRSDNILCLFKDLKNGIMVGTDNGGLYHFLSSSEETPVCYLTDVNSDDAISSNTVYSVIEVEPELMLIGTFAGGLDILNDYRHKFLTKCDKGGDGKCLSHKSVLSFYEEKNGKIWIGTDGGGLDLYDPKTDSYAYYTKENKKMPHSNVAKSLLVDSKSRVWVGSYAGGVAVFDSQMKPIKVYDMEHSINSNHIWRIMEDKDHYIWLATLNNGVERISPDLSKVDHYNFHTPGKSGLKSASITTIILDRKGKIWAVSESLHYFDPVLNRFVEYAFPGVDLPANARDLCVDKKGNLWVGTSDAAFFRVPYDDSKKPEIYPNSLGWFGNAIMSIQDDEDGNIWMATDVGISYFKYNTPNPSFLNFDMHDGVQTGQFNSGAKLRDSQGFIYFGGSEGYHRFRPKEIKLNYHLPKVSISEVRIFNQPLSELPKFNKRRAVFWNDSVVTFNYQDKMISLEFAGLDFVLPEKNRFAYILEGFDHNWNYSRSGIHIATYTNLDPGKYTFKVKAANNDGQWNDECSKLYIVILPPWWKTWWFRLLMGTSVVGALLGFYFWRTSSIRKRNIELHREVAAQTNELRQINEELMLTSEEVTRQNNEIFVLYNDLTESIQAAQVIQNAILPGKELLEEYFGRIEIFYKPKDVVSGDFYWCAKSGNRHLIAIVDCTGHGVAGAFMTFIGYETLNQIVRENADVQAGQVLSLLNKEIITSLNRYQSGIINAGMDVALCIIDEESNTLQFAGANNPLYIVRDQEVIIHKGDKQGVGGKQKHENYPFQTSVVKLEKGDQLYLFSDGYADQIGGENGTEKYMYPRFRQTLLDMRNLEIKKRISHLEEEFESWRNGYEQLDDVLVIAVEIS